MLRVTNVVVQGEDIGGVGEGKGERNEGGEAEEEGVNDAGNGGSGASSAAENQQADAGELETGAEEKGENLLQNNNNGDEDCGKDIPEAG